ncbi:hypothetical protein B0A81_16500 [Flavobacterium plurextorum]|uniref:Uncharacterized protein n=1 Tax=Flavobacterium plurextorum TaxID=1114867 RepID=A0ABX4CR81_9FLAO|nr:hypothetical protein [Flavobacterium plurextorum]OXB04763.1 hypothetical protein B0A81_16500 [Flavobacterium plurextorum]
MKYLYLFLFLTLFSCKSDPISIKQIPCKEIVILEDNYRDRKILKDSFRISIPIEFEILINSSKVKYITWNFRVDNKILDKDFYDYDFYLKENTLKRIYQLESDFLSNNKKITAIVRVNNYLISRTEALELIRKYNVNKSLDDLKPNSFIELTTYDKFRMENKSIINEFNKTADSISFKVARGEKYFFYLSKKIDW